MDKRLADVLNEAGVELTVKADCSEPDVSGRLPEDVRLPNGCGDAVDARGDVAFFDTGDRRWYPVGPLPNRTGR